MEFDDHIGKCRVTDVVKINSNIYVEHMPDREKGCIYGMDYNAFMSCLKKYN